MRPLRLRTPLLIAAVALAVIVGLVRAQQTAIDLVDGDDIAISCPTELTVTFDDASRATVNCAAEAESEDVTEELPSAPSP